MAGNYVYKCVTIDLDCHIAVPNLIQVSQALVQIALQGKAEAEHVLTLGVLQQNIAFFLCGKL